MRDLPGVGSAGPAMVPLPRELGVVRSDCPSLPDAIVLDIGDGRMSGEGFPKRLGILVPGDDDDMEFRRRVI